MALFVAVQLQDVIETQGGMFLFFCSLDSTVLISIFAGFNMFESFCIFSCCYVALFVAVELQDVEVFDRCLCPSEFLCI